MIRRPQRSTLFPSTTLFQSESEIRSADLYRPPDASGKADKRGSEEHTYELQSLRHLVCRLLLEKKKLLLTMRDVSRSELFRDRAETKLAVRRMRHVLVKIGHAIFFFKDTATTEIYPLSLHDALPIWNNAIVEAKPSIGRIMPSFTFMGCCCIRSEEHTSELQSLRHLVCRLLLEK